MERITLLLFLLLVSLFILCRAQEKKCQEEATAAGGTLRLQPEKHLEEWVKANWRVRLDDGHQQRILTAQKTKDNISIQYSQGRFLQRALFQENTLSLRISSVSPADRGVYHAKFEDASGFVTALCFRVSVWASTGDSTEVIRAVGTSVTFYIQNPLENAIVWSFQNDLIVVVEFGKPPKVTFFDKSYEERLAFPENGTALTISQLRMGDAGTYTAKTSEVKTTFTLHVFKELEVPEVSCVAHNCSEGSCHYTLLCTAPGSSSGNVSYSWSLGGLSWREGPTVLVEESPLEKLPPLTCTARNPVSSRNVTFVLSTALCADASWPYCWVKGLLCLLVLGSLVTAVAGTHVLIRRWGPPSHGGPSSSGAAWDPPNWELQSSR